MSSNTPPVNFSKLSDIEIGRSVMLGKNKVDQQLEKKLLALGFSKLIPLQVTQKRKGGMVVSIGNARIALNEALAEQIIVEPL
ncbi:MAG: ferrous iron transport protein A [Piscirickettsiaceae bacterium]|nr:MAG: ferrous iron transport protein A [Piscirickettsiaceae bacterium]